MLRSSNEDNKNHLSQYCSVWSVAYQNLEQSIKANQVR